LIQISGDDVKLLGRVFSRKRIAGFLASLPGRKFREDSDQIFTERWLGSALALSRRIETDKTDSKQVLALSDLVIRRMRRSWRTLKRREVYGIMAGGAAACLIVSTWVYWDEANRNKDQAGLMKSTVIAINDELQDQNVSIEQTLAELQAAYGFYSEHLGNAPAKEHLLAHARLDATFRKLMNENLHAREAMAEEQREGELHSCKYFDDWDSVTGGGDAHTIRSRDGTMEATLHENEYGSLFVVFSHKGAEDWKAPLQSTHILPPMQMCLSADGRVFTLSQRGRLTPEVFLLTPHSSYNRKATHKFIDWKPIEMRKYHRSLWGETVSRVFRNENSPKQQVPIVTDFRFDPQTWRRSIVYKLDNLWFHAFFYDGLTTPVEITNDGYTKDMEIDWHTGAGSGGKAKRLVWVPDEQNTTRCNENPDRGREAYYVRKLNRSNSVVTHPDIGEIWLHALTPCSKSGPKGEPSPADFSIGLERTEKSDSILDFLNYVISTAVASEQDTTQIPEEGDSWQENVALGEWGGVVDLAFVKDGQRTLVLFKTVSQRVYALRLLTDHTLARSFLRDRLEDDYGLTGAQIREGQIAMSPTCSKQGCTRYLMGSDSP
ncbi:MAG: hypothetical protein AAF501_17565, partial [Pseudomonadota bacterium]